MYAINTNKIQTKDIRKVLKEIKKINRYTYPEIVLMALKAFKAGLK